MEKLCSKCKIIKPLEEFYVNKYAKDGRSWHCKECSKKACREHYKEKYGLGRRCTALKKEIDYYDKNLKIERSIGRRIEMFRRQKRITQRELADNVGSIQQQICKIEAGENKVSASRLFLIADYLGVDINEFKPKRMRDKDDKQDRD